MAKNKGAGAPVRIDWEQMEADWRAGIKSAAVMPEEYIAATGQKVTGQGIRKNFVEKGIPRDLSAKIQAKADELVSKQLVSELVSGETAHSESQIIEANAQHNANIQVNERRDVTRARKLSMCFLDELEHQVENKDLYKQLGEF